jgi:hypothetical protein
VEHANGTADHQPLLPNQIVDPLEKLNGIALYAHINAQLLFHQSSLKDSAIHTSLIQVQQLPNGQHVLESKSTSAHLLADSLMELNPTLLQTFVPFT